MNSMGFLCFSVWYKTCSRLLGRNVSPIHSHRMQDVHVCVARGASGGCGEMELRSVFRKESRSLSSPFLSWLTQHINSPSLFSEIVYVYTN